MYRVGMCMLYGFTAASSCFWFKLLNVNKQLTLTSPRSIPYFLAPMAYLSDSRVVGYTFP